MKHNWEYKRLGDVCDITMGQSPDSVSYNTNEDGLPFFQGSSDFGEYYPEITTYCNAPSRIAEYNDILFSVRAPIGSMNFAPKKICIGRGLASIRAIHHNVQKYVYYILGHTNNILAEKGTGSTFKSITKVILHDHKIPVPPIEVQEQIVAELDKINELIEQNRELLRQLDLLAQSLFYDSFGDPVTNPKGWKTVKWDLLFETILGKMLDKNKQVESDEVLPYLANQNVQWGTFNLENLNTMTFSTKEKSKFKLRKGDILICEGGESGRCAIWQDEESNILFQKAVHRARIKDFNIINPYFVRFWLEFLKKNDGLKNYIVKSTIEHLTGMKLKTLPVPLPPLQLQQQFAAQIEAIEAQKATVEKSIAELQTLLDSRKDYWFN